MKFIFFTKTNWSESPRLRHQLCDLVVDAGHDVMFFQKPGYPFSKIKFCKNPKKEIKLFTTLQLIHHKLRIFKILHRINAYFEKIQIMKVVRNETSTSSAIIINFNYDYYFIKDIFPSNKIITIINDDSWSSALFNYQKPLLYALSSTLKISFKVFTVSLVLKKVLSTFCDSELLLPWSRDNYQKPKISSTRNTIIFWGFINDRLDFDIISNLASRLLSENIDYKLLFIGPNNCSKSSLSVFSSHSNLVLQGPTTLDDINFDTVFASIIPYKPNIKEVEATTIPNKALPLLSKGIPLVVSGMPSIIDLPFIYHLHNDTKENIALFQSIEKRFFDIQYKIKDYVNSNTSHIRRIQFLESI